jgi:deoxyribodipyrimidine photolyase-related protein
VIQRQVLPVSTGQQQREAMPVLHLILGDQLSFDISALRGCDRDRDHVLMAEVGDEATYAPHHRKKLLFVFSAMRHFAQALAERGYTVTYVRLTDQESDRSLTDSAARWARRLGVERLVMTEPGEYRLLQAFRALSAAIALPVDIRPDDRFLCSHQDFADWARDRRELRMEYFYRDMRRRFGLLMCPDGTPEGGAWNYDRDNRKAPSRDLTFAPRLAFPPDDLTRETAEMVRRRFGNNFGDLEPFDFAVTAEDAGRAFRHFLDHDLAQFGDYQDAMLSGEAFLFHSAISHYLNIGLLDPLSCCRAAEAAWRAGRAPLNAVEGFIRQILGWREFVRGIYWLKMPSYRALNHLGAERPLPDFYWTGATDMRCLAEVIGQTKRHAYSHHIQRLMVTGNFALLAGIAPAEICDWYLGVYADAYEWVELPNTLGMALFADGGIVGSKPYAASGNYINRMSDFCSGCRYDPGKPAGADACPFNGLYWRFMARNRPVLGANPRLRNVYATLDRMDPARREATIAQAERFLETLS